MADFTSVVYDQKTGAVRGHAQHAANVAGTLEFVHGSFVTTAALAVSDRLIVDVLPPGRCVFLARFSEVGASAGTFDLGWEAHTKLDGTAEAADPDGLADGETGANFQLDGTGNAVLEKVFESRAPVPLVFTNTGGGAIALGTTFSWSLAYLRA